jgi:archaellum component FlaC
MQDESLTRIENKLDKVQDKIGAIDVTLASQHVSLVEHIRRTELLEKDVAPIKKHVAMVHGGLKLVGLISLIAGIVQGAVSILAFLKGVH